VDWNEVGTPTRLAVRDADALEIVPKRESERDRIGSIASSPFVRCGSQPRRLGGDTVSSRSNVGLDGGGRDEQEPNRVEDDSGGVESVQAAAQRAPLLGVALVLVPAKVERSTRRHTQRECYRRGYARQSRAHSRADALSYLLRDLARPVARNPRGLGVGARDSGAVVDERDIELRRAASEACNKPCNKLGKFSPVLPQPKTRKSLQIKTT
jgi:hypothetical protein